MACARLMWLRAATGKVSKPTDHSLEPVTKDKNSCIKMDGQSQTCSLYSTTISHQVCCKCASVSYTAATLTSHTHSVPQVKKAGARRQSPEHRHISLLQVSWFSWSRRNSTSQASPKVHHIPVKRIITLSPASPFSCKNCLQQPAARCRQFFAKLVLRARASQCSSITVFAKRRTLSPNRLNPAHLDPSYFF